MSTFTDDERRKALNLANQVQDLAMDAPDEFAERVLHSAAHRLRRRYGYSRNLKKSEILRRVRKEPLGVTIVDLKNELGFHKDDVYELVRELEKELKVQCRKSAPGGSKGGRPTLLVSIATVTA